MLLLVNIIVCLITQLTIGLQIYAEIVFSVVLINFINSKLHVPSLLVKSNQKTKNLPQSGLPSGLITFRLSSKIKGAQETQSVD